MLSSIASLLPSALHLNPNQDLPRPTVNPDTEDEDDGDDNNNNERSQQYPYPEAGPQPSKKEGKIPNETFILVRPPPSKSNHPLNLQVQLVPPHAKPPSGVVPVGADATTPTSAHSTASSGSTSDGASLARTNSNRSENSFSRSSYNNSTSSFSSVASSTVSSNTRRTIIPLYNLQAHNVMTNVIVDAGTDAKIAKFQKRGIELIDLAFLEPVEVWGEKDNHKDARRESMRISVDEMGAMMTNVGMKGGLLSARTSTFLQAGGSRPVTPSAASSATSLHSHSNLRTTSPPQSQEAEAVPVIPVTSQPQPPAPPQKRNIFNKLFNKRNSSNVPLSSSEQPERESPFANFTLQPAPIANKLLGREGRRGGRGTPTPPPPALEVPNSPASSTSQQPTPTQLQPRTPRPQDDSPVSPTPTVAPAKETSREKEKGHSRNLSLTSAITTPFKTTLKNNKNRLSAVMNGGGPSGGGGLTVPNAQAIEERGEAQALGLQKSKRDASPMRSLMSNSRSQLSLDAVMAADAASSNGHGQPPSTPQQGLYPHMLAQSQAREDLVSLKQQQLQLRPPVLGIQPSFVSSAASAPPPLGAGLASPLVAALSPRITENPENVLQGQRALMYVWLVRKWLKRRPSTLGVPNPFGEQGFLGGLAGKVGKNHQQGTSDHGHGHALEGSTASTAGVSAPPPLPHGGVEVRFEWKRARTKEKKGSLGAKKSRRGRQSRGTEASYGADSDGEVERRERTRDRAEVEKEFRERDRTRERDERMDPKERLKSEAKKAKRMSTGSFSTTHSVSEEGGGRDDASVRERRRRESAAGGDEDEDSDPEDSETPWVCTLKVRKSVAAPIGLTSPGAPPSGLALVHPQVLRVKVGTLSPTPHHPKVVAMLKVPFPLPDVEVERLGVVRRKVFPIGGGNPRPDSRAGGGEGGMQGQGEEGGEEDSREPYNGLTLTAEEIKDVVCSTGLWLVVREGIGGVGRVSRKGDGWRIRA